MPDIPNFLNEVTDFQRRVPPVYDPATMAMPGRILARGGEEFSAEMGVFAQRYREARQQSDAANTVFNATKSIEDLQQKYSLMPDHQAALTGFTKDFATLRDQTLAGITDPQVKSYVTRRLDEEGIARTNEVGRASLGLEASTRRGELDERMAHAADQAAAAADPLNRQRIIDEAIGDVKGSVAAGWLKPEEGALHELRFKSMVQEVAVRKAINAAYDSQSASQMHRVEALLQDPSQFPGLLPEKREMLQQQVAGQAMRFESRAIAAQAHADAVRERELRESQDQNAAILLSTPKDQMPSLADVNTMARHKQLSENGVAAYNRRMAEMDKGETTNWPLALHLTEKFYEGDPDGDVHQQVLAAVAEGQIAGELGLRLMGKVPANPDVTKGSEMLKTVFDKTQTTSFASATPDEKEMAQRTYAAVLGDYGKGLKLLKPGESPIDLAKSIIRGYGTPVGVPNYGTPTYADGPITSMDDVKRAWALTDAARQAKRIGDADYYRQAELLNQYKNYLELTRPKETGLTGTTPTTGKPKPGSDEFKKQLYGE